MTEYGRLLFGIPSPNGRVSLSRNFVDAQDLRVRSVDTCRDSPAEPLDIYPLADSQLFARSYLRRPESLLSEVSPFFSRRVLSPLASFSSDIGI